MAGWRWYGDWLIGQLFPLNSAARTLCRGGIQRV
jgi:hypothetical protein